MSKYRYKINFEIEGEEPIRELKIKLVDKNGNKTSAALPVPEEKPEKQAVNHDEEDDDIEYVEVPPEMNMDF